jgi:hypothetical protein
LTRVAIVLGKSLAGRRAITGPRPLRLADRARPDGVRLRC